ncbi:MAG: hypothetical protein HY376_02730 [Candidatus Blackburnbacteria bacterium]|nr:hypothetical protein [Candidatus Blackburnbacteria bacterium]
MRVWTLPICDGYAILDRRTPEQALPGGSIPLYAFGGKFHDGEVFGAEEAQKFVKTYGLENMCVFETWKKTLPVQDLNMCVRLYSTNARLPDHYPIVEYGGKLVIPLENGQTVGVDQGEWFVGLPKGCRGCGIFDPRPWRAAVQEPDEWINFDHPLVK